MTTRELRPLVLKALRSQGWNQIGNIAELVGKLAAETGYSPSGRPSGLDEDDELRVLDVIWELIAAHVVAPGLSAHMSTALPFLHLTEHGRKCLEHDEYLPYNPDGYLERLSTRVLELDDTVRLYVTESVQAFRHNLPLSSAVTLGAASEQVFLIASDALAAALPPAAQGSYRKKTSGKPIKKHFEEFMKRLPNVVDQLPGNVQDNLETDWNGIFNLIRNSRNDAGHPARPHVDMDEAAAGLQLFLGHCERAMLLAASLGNQGGS